MMEHWANIGISLCGGQVTLMVFPFLLLGFHEALQVLKIND
jgi:hypothetical protein